MNDLQVTFLKDQIEVSWYSHASHKRIFATFGSIEEIREALPLTWAQYVEACQVVHEAFGI